MGRWRCKFIWFLHCLWTSLFKHVQGVDQAFDFDQQIDAKMFLSCSNLCCCKCVPQRRYRTKSKVCRARQFSEARAALERIAIYWAIAHFLDGGIHPVILRKLRDHHWHFVATFTAGVPALHRPPEIETLARKGRLVSRIDAAQSAQFTQRCRMQFAATDYHGHWIPGSVDYFTLWFLWNVSWIQLCRWEISHTSSRYLRIPVTLHACSQSHCLNAILSRTSIWNLLV